MNPSQEKAVSRITHFLNEHITDNERANYGREAHSFKIKEMNENLISITAQVENMNQEFGNYLRAVSHEHWHFFIGHRGGIRVVACPKAFMQFSGKYAFGMKFDSYYLNPNEE